MMLLFYKKDVLISLLLSKFLLLLLPVICFADANIIFKENSKAVVLIYAYDKNGRPISQGSGFIVRNDGAIATNYHVISNAADIKIKAGSEILRVEGLLYIERENDLAILKADGKDLPTVKIGDIAEVSIGEKVYVIGSPEGLENTISDGILSGIREITPKRKMLQLTAPISAGSSGGPVFNKYGEVIGIATSLIDNAQNLNFAMPVSLIKDNIGKIKVIDFKDAEIGDYKKTAEYWFNLGFAYSSSEMFKKAIEAFKQAVKIKSDYAEAYNNLGCTYGELGIYKEAFKAFKHSIRIKPDDEKAHYNLGFAYMMSGMYKEAIEANKQAIRIKPDLTEAHSNLGVCYLFLNDRGSALDEYKILKNLDPEKADKLFDLIYK